MVQKRCQTVTEEECQTVTEKKCKSVHRERCKNVDEEVCTTNHHIRKVKSLKLQRAEDPQLGPIARMN